METKRREEISVPQFGSKEEKAQYLEAVSRREVLFPWMNGGMGVNMSADRLVSAIMNEGGVGTLAGSAAGAEDFFNEGLPDNEGAGNRVERFHQANQVAILRQIHSVRGRIPHGILAVNEMAAMSDFERTIETLGESGEVDIAVVGAGLGRGLAERVKQYPNMHHMPIVSSARAAKIILKMAIKADCLPIAFYVELPQFAGGHLGAKDVADAEDTKKFAPQIILDEILAVFEEDVIKQALQKAGRPRIPLILAGGIVYGKDVNNAYSMGYDGVSMGTRPLLTKESGMPDRTIGGMYLNPEYVTETGMTSPARMPSRYLVGPGAMAITENVEEVKRQCISCIGSSKCKFMKPEGEINYYCIVRSLVDALQENNGRLFTGSRRDEMMDDSLYEREGQIYIPTVREAIAFVLGRRENA